MINTAILGITVPVTGATPVTAISSAQYTGAISWLPAVAAFVEGTAYTAAITLTKRDGYTFNGIAANAFTVTGAAVTSPAGTSTDTTLAVSAVFPATAAAAPDIDMTFTDVSDFTVWNSSVELVDSTGYKVTTTQGNGYTQAWFEVTIPATYDLASYSKISFNFTMDASGQDGGYKSPRIYALAALPGTLDQTLLVDDNKLVTAGTNTGNAGTKTPYDLSITVPATFSGVQTLYLCFNPWANGGAIFIVENIKIHN